MYQARDGHLIEVTTMKELSLGWSKGGRGHLREIYFPVLFYNYMYFRTLITGHLLAVLAWWQFNCTSFIKCMIIWSEINFEILLNFDVGHGWCQQVAPEGLNWNLRSMSTALTIFNSNKFIRVLLPKLVIFLCVTHQGKNNFLNNSLLQRQWTISSKLLHKNNF